MSNFIHRWLNPHCTDCITDRMEKNVCSSCETLKHLLDVEKHEKQLLLDSILNANKPQVESIEIERESIKPKMVNWNERRRMLETEDRERARLEKRNKETIVSDKELEKLEAEMESVKEKQNA